MNQLIEFDHDLFHWINAGLANSFFDFLMPILRNRWTWAPLYFIVIFIAFKKWGWQRTLYFAAGAGVLILLSDQIVLHAFKLWFERLRPCRNMHLGFAVRNVGVDCGSGFSFVSAHAANHMALAIYFGKMLWPTKRAIRGGWIVWALSIAFAQIYVGLHYPADVTIGALIGLGAGWIISKYLVKYASEVGIDFNI